MIGDILRAERESQGLTVKDVERETSIRALYIEGIENSDYDSLPSEVYVKGFIRNYAAFLKLNPDLVLQQYREERHGTETAEEPENNSVPAKKESSERMFSSGEDFKERVHKSHRYQNLFIVAAVIICGFVGSIYYFFGGDDSQKKPTNTVVAEKNAEVKKKEPVPAKTDNKAAVKPETKKEAKQPETKKDDKAAEVKKAEEPAKNDKTAESKAEKPAVPVQPAGRPGRVNVGAAFSDYCWLRVLVDGKTVFEGTADKGQTLSWAGQERVFVLIGNAGAVELSHNGRSLGKAGKIGEVIEKDFSAPGVAGKARK